MSLDVQRRDGRTAISCDEIVTVKGFMLSQTKTMLVIKTSDSKIDVEKGSFKYDELDHEERYYVLARKGEIFKLVDYVKCF